MAQTEAEAAAQAKDQRSPVLPKVRAWDDVLQFWLPDSPDEDLETHSRHWAWRMRDGADAEIVARFSDLTEHAAAGVLDQWAEDPRGRLALLILLDQFPRSVWRDSPRAFAQDPHALTLALEGLENGHFAALRMPWERLSYVIVLGHCEGPDHLARLERGHRIAQEVHNEVPDQPQAQLRVRGRAASPASPRHRGVRAIPSSQRAPGTGLHARGGGLHRGRTVPASTADLVVSPIGG